VPAQGGVGGGAAGGSVRSGTIATDLVGSSGSRTTRSRSSAPGGSPGTDATMTVSLGGGAKTSRRPRATPVPIAPSADFFRQRSKALGLSSGAGWASSSGSSSGSASGSMRPILARREDARLGVHQDPTISGQLCRELERKRDKAQTTFIRVARAPASASSPQRDDKLPGRAITLFPVTRPLSTEVCADVTYGSLNPGCAHE
jgi:hypothetical protein